MGLTTNCTICGKLVTYTTRKPLKCTECKKPTPKPRKGGRFPRNKGTSGELLLFAILQRIIVGYPYINHGFYSILLSPKFQPLQLDRYYPGLNLAFEYDGKQHDEYIKYIHKSRKNFTYQQQCDKIKDKECKANGVTLIRIGHKDKITEKLLIEKIKTANEALYIRMLKEGTLIDNDG